jgi:putative flippase GtrA
MSNLIKFLKHYLAKEYLEILRYFFVGAASACLDILIFVSFIYLLDFIWYFAALISFIFSTALNFYLSKKYVFLNSSSKLRLQFFLICIVSIIALTLNYLILYLTIDLMKFTIIYSKFLAIIGCFFFNYLLRKYFVFTKVKNNDAK